MKKYAGLTSFGHRVKDTITGKSMEFATDEEAYEFIKDYIQEECKNKKPVSLDELDKY